MELEHPYGDLSLSLVGASFSLLRCVYETCVLLELVVDAHLDASDGTCFGENIQRH